MHISKYDQNTRRCENLSIFISKWDILINETIEMRHEFIYFSRNLNTRLVAVSLKTVSIVILNLFIFGFLSKIRNSNICVNGSKIRFCNLLISLDLWCLSHCYRQSFRQSGNNLRILIKDQLQTVLKMSRICKEYREQLWALHTSYTWIKSNDSRERRDFNHVNVVTSSR